MGWVLMSERDVQRIEILTEVLSGTRTVSSAAIVLAISIRQVGRLLTRFRDNGGGALVHRGRGQASNHRADPDLRKRVLELIRTKYADFGPTLAIEVLLDKHDIRIGRETLRTWMVDDGLWLSRKQRRSFHQPRLRRESYGELIQIDGSEHRWFERRGEPCTLLVFIDDATSKLMQLRFVRSESTDSYFEALQGYLETHGCPTAFYSDKHTVFRVNKPDAKGGSGMTQFGRALAELNIEILCANSSQAKGRVERANRTLQDRLVKELRLENVSDILCHREQRYVGEQLTLSYDRKQIILERSELSERLAGQHVEIYDFAGRPMEVRWKGYSLPYRIFSKDQRVSHTSVVENKRLGHALSIVKAQQDLRRAPKIMTNSEKIGYKKRPRTVYGPPEEVISPEERTTVEV
jgi:transposase